MATNFGKEDFDKMIFSLNGENLTTFNAKLNHLIREPQLPEPYKEALAELKKKKKLNRPLITLRKFC